MNKIEASFKVKGYKSFGDVPQGFDVVRPINLIIGRNNGGKSALLDLVKFVCDNEPGTLAARHRYSQETSIVYKKTVDSDMLKHIPDNRSGGHVPGGVIHRDFFSILEGKSLLYEKNMAGEIISINFNYDEVSKGVLEPLEKMNYQRALLESIKHPLLGKLVVKLDSERDLKLESDSEALDFLSNGQGGTNLIQSFCNKINLEADHVERRMLEALNQIFIPDRVEYIKIKPRQNPANKTWEIFLEDSHRGLVSISNSGSGLKTILLVLVALYLVPQIKNQQINNLVFLFEELENNLHPALQRSLMSFLMDFAKKNDCILFLTTHSNVAIDLMSHDEDVQIVHVKHNGRSAEAEPLVNYFDGKKVLADLDVRASDLLQSNCVVWLEGPSDRIYLNKWIELWTKDDEFPLKEGLHYQCIFYGGRLLSHLSAELPAEEMAENVRILNVNTNAVVLIDSDKSEESDEINSTKKRIVTEFSGFGGISWVTQGREVENYLPSRIIKAEIGEGVVLGKFDDFGAKVDETGSKWKKFEKKKVRFAENAIIGMTKEDLNECLDLSDRLESVVQYIRKCNGY